MNIIGLIVCVLTSLYLFTYCYVKVNSENKKEKVFTLTFVFAICMAYLFTGLSYVFLCV